MTFQEDWADILPHRKPVVIPTITPKSTRGVCIRDARDGSVISTFADTLPPTVNLDLMNRRESYRRFYYENVSDVTNCRSDGYGEGTNLTQARVNVARLFIHELVRTVSAFNTWEELEAAMLNNGYVPTIHQHKLRRNQSYNKAFQVIAKDRLAAECEYRGYKVFRGSGRLAA